MISFSNMSRFKMIGSSNRKIQIQYLDNKFWQKVFLFRQVCISNLIISVRTLDQLKYRMILSQNNVFLKRNLEKIKINELKKYNFLEQSKKIS